MEVYIVYLTKLSLFWYEIKNSNYCQFIAFSV